VPPDLLVNDKNSSGVKERERNAGPGFPKVRHTQNDNAEEAKKIVQRVGCTRPQRRGGKKNRTLYAVVFFFWGRVAKKKNPKWFDCVRPWG
jgi:hypothetical protein